MSTLIPEMLFSEFKRLNTSELRELKAVEVTSDGVYLFTAIIPHGDMAASDYVRTQAEYLGVKANISGGKQPDEIMGEVPV